LRGVAGVMPCEFKREEHSKGLALIRKGEVRHSPITELEYTMETMQRLISEIAVKYILIFYVLFEVSISEEPDVGNPQVRFCEGHASPYTKFINLRKEATCLLDLL